MDPGSLNNKTNAPRKMRFAPKAPPCRAPKPEVKTEATGNDNTAQAMDLLRRINECSMNARPKVEKKVAASQIAFGFGGAATSMKHGVPKGGSSSNYSGSYCASQMKEYKEPWDYYSYYPVTLPLRRPYSGNPEILDEEEFGEVTETAVYNESSVNPALELGLMEDNAEPKMLFLQLPPTLPLLKRPAKANGHEVGDSSRPSGGARTTEKTCGLDDLPAGLMGKMLVYKSGAVKLKLGDTLYDVNPGLNCVFAQDVATINTTEKHCCVVGELNNRAIVTPDIDSVLNSTEDF